MRQIGSQRRESLSEAGLKILPLTPKQKKAMFVGRHDLVLQLENDPYQNEVWFANDDFAGNVIEIDGVGYEFARSIPYNVFEDALKAK